MFPFLGANRNRQLGKEQHAYQHTDVVGHLRVQEKADISEERHQHGSPTVLLAVGKDKTDDNQRHPRDGIALTMMGGSNDDKEIAGKGYGKSTRHADPLVDLKSAKQQEEGNQIVEKYEERIACPPP